MNTDRKAHWEQVYATRRHHELSWIQPVPETSLQLIRALHLPAQAPIIDVGGGDSLLVDHLLAEGFTDITVLDISAQSLARARQRLGENAGRVHWVESDITVFRPERTYTLWHDRATFHFLTRPEEVQQYLVALRQASPDYFILGTFSENGPDTCSGLHIQQYNEDSMARCFAPGYIPLRFEHTVHVTPAGVQQQFLFGCFRKNPA